MRPLPMLAILLVAAECAGQESLDDLDKAGPAEAVTEVPKSPTAEVNGYLSNRLTGTWVSTSGPVPTRDVPSLQDLLEANVQLKVRLGKSAFAYGDLSLLLQGGWLYYRDDGAGGRERVGEHDVSSLHPLVAPSELYLSWSPASWLNLAAGKKRIVWGSGFAFNPTDLVNPPKDPTDPSFQRAGAFLARVELPFEKLTMSALFVPQVLYEKSGLPYAMFKYSDYPVDGQKPPDDQFHYLVAARLYALVYDADINLIYYFSNRFRDGFENKSRFGASFSRYFFTDYELHVDALFQTGSARSYPNHACVAAGQGPGSPDCAIPTRDAASASKLDDSAIYPRLLVGGRTMFKDESSLSIEYYYQADGFSDGEFEDAIRGLLAAKALLDQGLIVPGAGGGASGGAAPAKFSFDPLRRHYLIISYTKPKIRDDWAVGMVMIAGLQDLSGLLSPSVSWNVREWLTLSLTGFVPVRGIPVGQVKVGEESYSEYALLPFDARVLFEARAFY